MRGGVSGRAVGAVGNWRARVWALALVASALVVAPAPASALASTHRPSAHRHYTHRHGGRHVRSSGACPNANLPVGGASPHTLRAAVVCLVNKQRAAHGLPGLHAAPLLNRSAQGWTNSMVHGDFFSHGSNFAARISAVGFLWSSAGENIATGFLTPRQVVRAWMGSTGHCQNILNPTFRDVGTGVSASAVRGYATGEGTWTQDFALPRGQRPLSGNYAPSNGCPY